MPSEPGPDVVRVRETSTGSASNAPMPSTNTGPCRSAVDAYDTNRESRITTPAHRYLSTACHHGHHADCATGGTRWDGTSKTPAQCKWCDAKCECRECDHNPLVMDGDQQDRG